MPEVVEKALLALGRGDKRSGRCLAAIALYLAPQVWLAIAIVMALGPGR